MSTHPDADSVEQQIHEHQEQQRVLDQSWLWHIPRSRFETFLLGVSVPLLAAALVFAVAMPAWPVWAAVAIVAVLAPYIVVAAGMALRAWFTGVGVAAAAVATTPALVWTLVVTVARAAPLPGWAQWCMVAGYVALAVGTVWFWRWWTHATRSTRQRMRWAREATDI